MQWKFWKNEKPENGDRVILYDMTEDTYAIFTYVDSKKGDKRPYILDTEGYSLGCIDDDVYNTKIAWCKIGDCIILTEDEIEEIENLVILHVVNPENKVSYNTKGYWEVIDNNNQPLGLYGEYDGLDIKKQYTIEQLRYALREESTMEKLKKYEYLEDCDMEDFEYKMFVNAYHMDMSAWESEDLEELDELETFKSNRDRYKKVYCLHVDDAHKVWGDGGYEDSINWSDVADVLCYRYIHDGGFSYEHDLGAYDRIEVLEYLANKYPNEEDENK